MRWSGSRKSFQDPPRESVGNKIDIRWQGFERAKLSTETVLADCFNAILISEWALGYAFVMSALCEGRKAHKSIMFNDINPLIKKKEENFSRSKIKC